MVVTLKKFAKDILFHSPARKIAFPRYPYNFRAPQLCFICDCVERTRDVPGAIAEVGCSTGWTAAFLNDYLSFQGIEKPYYALDTFSGFVPEDVEIEVNQRGKKRWYFNEFQTNKRKWFDGAMAQSGATRVKSIEADVNQFDLKSLGPLSFVLLDVDLYRPIKKALAELYEALSPNGIIVVDDCDETSDRWDGADQAYKEFVSEMGLPVDIRHGKLGVIVKSAGSVRAAVAMPEAKEEPTPTG